MASSHSEVRLADVADIVMGQSPPGRTYNKDGIGLPFYQGVSDFNYRHPTPRIYCSEPKRVAEPGDILFSVRAPIGRVNVADHECAVGRGVSIIRARNKEDSRYLEFALRSLASTWQFLEGGGSVFGNATKRDLQSLLVPWPERSADRRAIAHILGTLDDKIDLNRRMSETLEAMARALFKSWFVDFDPVRAKAEGRDPGLPKLLADLFPSRLVDSELGPIPEGWDVATLGDLVDIVKGRSYRSADLVESDTALVTLKSFARGGGYRPDGLKPFAGDYKPEQVVEPGDILVACTDITQAAEVIGRAAMVRDTGGYQRLVASLDMVVMRPRVGRTTRSFLYFLGRSEPFVGHMLAHTTGTTVLHLAKEAVPSFMFPCPPDQVIQRFDAVAAPVLGRLRLIGEEARMLVSTRDTLLPKLLSGEVPIAANGRTND